MARQMRAAYYEEFGGAGKIRIGNIDIPEIKEGEVLVKLKLRQLILWMRR